MDIIHGSYCVRDLYQHARYAVEGPLEQGNVCLFPLYRNGGSSYRPVDEKSLWSAEHLGSGPEKPGW